MNRAAQITAARGALSRGDLNSTHRFATTLVTGDPEDAEGYFLLGIAASSAGQVNAGIQHLVQAVALDPQGEYRAQLAKLLAMVRRDGDAAATLRDAERALPADALSRDTMGCVYARLGDHAAALPHFDEAVRLAPRNPEYRYNHAATLNFLGRTDEADAALEALIALAPADARAHHLLSGLRKQTPASNHVERLARTHTSDGRGRLLIGYALAKELEDIGQPAAALEKLCAANAEHRRTLPYSFARDAAMFDAIAASWPTIAAAPATASPPDAPIYIIGMPRTGTTLVDRILSSHPDVESAGELQAMPLAVKQASGTRGPMVMDPETVTAAAGRDMGNIGRDYLQRARHHRRDLGCRFTDKFPGNFHYAGFIARALPGARLVCLRRHPMDTVLGNFRNLFAVGSRYYDYSYDLLDIAAYYVRFDRLMNLWRDAFPERLIELRYEDLVADQEGQTRRLLAHCRLAWSQDCLSFHTNRAPVSTPSAAQVRQPIYADAVARWRRYSTFSNRPESISIKGIMLMPARLRPWRYTMAAFAIASTTAPAMAASAPTSQLVACPSGTCLVVEGHRDDPAAAVSINGHAVVVNGQRNWQARLPLAVVRAWSLPLARTITITMHDTQVSRGTVATADLPIGLLGHSQNLALLVIGVR